MQPQTQRNVAKILILTTAVTAVSAFGGCSSAKLKHPVGAPAAEGRMGGKKHAKKSNAPAEAQKPAEAQTPAAAQAYTPLSPSPFEKPAAPIPIEAPVSGLPAIPTSEALPPIGFPGVATVSSDNTNPPSLPLPVQAEKANLLNLGTTSLPEGLRIDEWNNDAMAKADAANAKKQAGGVKFKMPGFLKRALAWLQSLTPKGAEPATATGPAPAPKKTSVSSNGFDASAVAFGAALLAALGVLGWTIWKGFSGNPQPKALPTEPPLPEEQEPKGRVRWTSKHSKKKAKGSRTRA